MTMMSQPSSRVVLGVNSNPQARLRLFCFPYAGGTTAIYQDWPDLLPSSVEVCPVQLPGRGMRYADPLIPAAQPLVADLATALLPHLDRPYALFGHSMGAILAFEMARLLRREGQPRPVRLLVAGRRAPDLPLPYAPVHALPDPDFIDELRRLNGTPAEVLQHQELMQMVLPMLRADFAVVETYSYIPEPPLDCPISAFGGSQDSRTSFETLEAWSRQTKAGVTVRILPGHHFFINQERTALLQAIARDLPTP